MTRRQVEVDGVRHIIAPLEAPAGNERSCALVRIRVQDEITGLPPRTPISALLSQPRAAGLGVRVVDAGLIGVSGRAARAFSPDLATNARIEIDVSAPRFTPRTVRMDFACGLRRLTAAPASDVLTLDSTAGLQPGQRLLLSTPAGAQVEFGAIGALGPAANQVTLTRPPTLTFPVDSRAQPLPADQTLTLHRTPVSLRGRVLRKTGTTLAPLANATVSVTRIWRQLPRAGTTTTPEPPVPGPAPSGSWPAPIASLWPPVYADLAAASVVIEDRAVDAGMPAKLLLDDVARGVAVLRVSNSNGLSPLNVLAVDADDPMRREIVVAMAVKPSSSSADDWAEVTLNQPLNWAHRRGVVVRRLQAPAGATSIPLNHAAARGDEVLLFDAGTFSGTHQIRLNPGTLAQSSFHQLTQFSTVSDAEGFYRLPALMRAGKVEVLARGPGPGPVAQRALEFIPDYDSSENQLDIVV